MNDIHEMDSQNMRLCGTDPFKESVKNYVGLTGASSPAVANIK
jgi:hypothetical protein